MLIWFPPFGFIALLHSFKALINSNKGNRLEAQKNGAKARSWVFRSLIGGTAWFVLFAWIVFLVAGKHIAPLATFY